MKLIKTCLVKTNSEFGTQWASNVKYIKKTDNR